MDLIVQNHTALWGPDTFQCSIGPHGFTEDKREGDGKTPIGCFRFRQAFYRPDRIKAPTTSLPISPITPDCGWCDDADSPSYNKYITKPFKASHEEMWMERALYDLVIVVGHNDAPPEPGKGSAIFIHIAPDNYGPTAGCIGLAKKDLLRVFAEAAVDSKLVVSNQ